MDTKTLAAAMGYTDKQVKNVQAGGVSDSYIQEQITNNPTVASKVTMDEVNTQVIELLDDKLYYVTPEMFGAKGDGVTDDTEAFEKMFMVSKNVKCNPLSEYAVQTIELVSNITVDFCNAKLCKIGNDDTTPTIKMNGVENVALLNVNIDNTGNGLGGTVIHSTDTKNITFDNISVITNHAFNESKPCGNWVFNLSGENIKLKNIYIDSYESSKYGDGIHVGWVDGLVIDGFDIRSGDDSISIYPQDASGASTVDLPSKNIVIKNGKLASNGFSCLKFGCANETGRENYYVNDVLIENVDFREQEASYSSVIICEERKTVNHKHKTIEFRNCKFGNYIGADTTNYNGYIDCRSGFDSIILDNCLLDINEEIKTSNYPFNIQNCNNVNIRNTELYYKPDRVNGSGILTVFYIAGAENINVDNVKMSSVTRRFMQVTNIKNIEVKNSVFIQSNPNTYGIPTFDFLEQQKEDMNIIFINNIMVHPKMSNAYAINFSFTNDVQKFIFIGNKFDTSRVINKTINATDYLFNDIVTS